MSRFACEYREGGYVVTRTDKAQERASSRACHDPVNVETGEVEPERRLCDQGCTCSTMRMPPCAYCEAGMCLDVPGELREVIEGWMKRAYAAERRVLTLGRELKEARHDGAYAQEYLEALDAERRATARAEAACTAELNRHAETRHALEDAIIEIERLRAELGDTGAPKPKPKARKPITVFKMPGDVDFSDRRTFAPEDDPTHHLDAGED